MLYCHLHQKLHFTYQWYFSKLLFFHVNIASCTCRSLNTAEHFFRNQIWPCYILSFILRKMNPWEKEHPRIKTSYWQCWEHSPIHYTICAHSYFSDIRLWCLFVGKIALKVVVPKPLIVRILLFFLRSVSVVWLTLEWLPTHIWEIIAMISQH